MAEEAPSPRQQFRREATQPHRITQGHHRNRPGSRHVHCLVVIERVGGRIVADRYVLADRLGSGGMGTVWRAWDHLLQRTVAVKELHAVGGGYEQQASMRRVLTEARAIARVTHAHVIDIYDLVEFDGGFWIVMELVPGGSLSERVRSSGPLSAVETARVGLEVLSALEAVHAAGALHRDVKPANVLLRADGSIVLTDFGIAALSGHTGLTGTGGVVGSAEYMAPERLRDQPAGPASDLFSLGVTMCFLATGQSPFARGDLTATSFAVAFEPPSVHVRGPLGDIVEQLLDKDPAKRPSSAQLAEALRSVADGVPRTVQATLRQPVRPPRANRRRTAAAGANRRRKAITGAIAVAVLLVGAGVTASVVGDDSGPGSPEQTGRTSTGTHAVSRVDAVMPVPGVQGRFWVFAGSEYMVVEVGASPASARRVSGPSPIAQWRKTFGGLERFTGKIDAVLPVPGDAHRFWVFSGDQYLLVHVAGDRSGKGRLQEPRPLTDWSNSIGAAVGFPHGVDAVMPVPGVQGRFWVFAGSEYMVVEVGASPASARRVSGPSPIAQWRKTFGGLERFTGKIDAVLPVPGDAHRFWVFSGDQYLLVHVAGDRSGKGRLQEPHPLTDWPSLRPFRTD
ncbi:protein kinase [Streptomyces sp. NPDC058807]|uniref:protein kinase domain-containing protein n=1 Tax=unclassified Streptomyces TaxID=2593676 RepID=UPI0036814A4F